MVRSWTTAVILGFSHVAGPRHFAAGPRHLYSDSHSFVDNFPTHQHLLFQDPAQLVVSATSELVVWQTTTLPESCATSFFQTTICSESGATSCFQMTIFLEWCATSCFQTTICPESCATSCFQTTIYSESCATSCFQTTIR